jgi:ClpP class serine protease
VAARLGRPLDNAHAVAMHGSTAVIPVNGPIFRYASLFSDISGATSAEVLARRISGGARRPAVAGILLEIDSPGGEVSGTAELAAMIRAAPPSASRSTPTWTTSGHRPPTGCPPRPSRITASSTAILGSIGVVSALPNPEKRDAKDIEFVSSQSPKKRADITTEAGRAQVQTVVDASRTSSCDVARYRGVSTDAVLSDFGQGDVFVGQSAVDAGLVDGIGSFEQALAAFADAAQRRGGPTARIRESSHEHAREVQRLARRTRRRGQRRHGGSDRDRPSHHPAGAAGEPPTGRTGLRRRPWRLLTRRR